MICHHSATLDSLRHCGSRDTIILVFFTNLQDWVIKGSYDLWIRGPQGKSPQ